MDLRMCLATISGYHMGSPSTQILISKSNSCLTKLVENSNTPKHETVSEFCDYYKDSEDITYLNSKCGRIDIDICDVRNWGYCPSCGREIVIRDNHGKPEEIKWIKILYT